MAWRETLAQIAVTQISATSAVVPIRRGVWDELEAEIRDRENDCVYLEAARMKVDNQYENDIEALAIEMAGAEAALAVSYTKWNDRQKQMGLRGLLPVGVKQEPV